MCVLNCDNKHILWWRALWRKFSQKLRSVWCVLKHISANSKGNAGDSPICLVRSLSTLNLWCWKCENTCRSMGISVVGDSSYVVPLGRDGLILRNMLWFICCWTPSVDCGVLDSFMVLPSVSGLANVTAAFMWQMCWNFALIRAVPFSCMQSWTAVPDSPLQFWIAWLNICCLQI